MEYVKEHGDEELYARIDSSYSSGDEDVEVPLLFFEMASKR